MKMKRHFSAMAILVIATLAKSETNEWTEVCPSCGQTTFHYAFSFDTDDYAVISFLMKNKPIQENYLLAYAPHGPTPSCDSHFTTNDYPFLKQKIPSLLEETYTSFLHRNQHIAVHHVKEFKDANGRPVRVTQKATTAQSASQFSRIGFSNDRTQILIFNGEIYLLYRKNDNGLELIGKYVRWIS